MLKVNAEAGKKESARRDTMREIDGMDNIYRSLSNSSLNEYFSDKNISAPNDPREIEADRVARSVAANISSGEIMRSASTASGAMDSSVKLPMEQAFGRSFDNVKIHTDSRADVLSRSINADAFTTGNDIYFKDGMYNPSSMDGKELLAHELTHITQSNTGICRKLIKGTPGKKPTTASATKICKYMDFYDKEISNINDEVTFIQKCLRMPSISDVDKINNLDIQNMSADQAKDNYEKLISIGDFDNLKDYVAKISSDIASDRHTFLSMFPSNGAEAKVEQVKEKIKNIQSRVDTIKTLKFGGMNVSPELMAACQKKAASILVKLGNEDLRSAVLSEHDFKILESPLFLKFIEAVSGLKSNSIQDVSQFRDANKASIEEVDDDPKTWQDYLEMGSEMGGYGNSLATLLSDIVGASDLDGAHEDGLGIAGGVTSVAGFGLDAVSYGLGVKDFVEDKNKRFKKLSALGLAGDGSTLQDKIGLGGDSLGMVNSILGMAANFSGSGPMTVATGTLSVIGDAIGLGTEGMALDKTRKADSAAKAQIVKVLNRIIEREKLAGTTKSASLITSIGNLLQMTSGHLSSKGAGSSDMKFNLEIEKILRKHGAQSNRPAADKLEGESIEELQEVGILNISRQGARKLAKRQGVDIGLTSIGAGADVVNLAGGAMTLTGALAPIGLSVIAAASAIGGANTAAKYIKDKVYAKKDAKKAVRRRAEAAKVSTSILSRMQTLPDFPNYISNGAVNAQALKNSATQDLTKVDAYLSTYKMLIATNIDLIDFLYDIEGIKKTSGSTSANAVGARTKAQVGLFKNIEEGHMKRG